MKLADLISKVISQFLPLFSLSIQVAHLPISLRRHIYIKKKKKEDWSYCELVLIITGKPVSDVAHYLKILHDVLN